MIMVTGGTSAIADAIAREASQRNLECVLTTRDMASTSNPFFTLGRSSQAIFEHQPIAIIHLAWDMNDRSDVGRHTNVEGSKTLVIEARKRGTKIVFLSSFSADSSQTSKYGQMKKEVEEVVLQNNGVVVRAGIIWGNGATGIIETLSKLANFPLVCLHLSPEPRLFHTNLDQLAVLLVDCALKENMEQSKIRAASIDPISLSEIFHKLGVSRIPRLHIRMSTELINIMISSLAKITTRLTKFGDSFSALEQNDTERILADQEWEWAANFYDIEFLQR